MKHIWIIYGHQIMALDDQNQMLFLHVIYKII